MIIFCWVFPACIRLQSSVILCLTLRKCGNMHTFISSSIYYCIFVSFKVIISLEQSGAWCNTTSLLCIYKLNSRWLSSTLLSKGGCLCKNRVHRLKWIDPKCNILNSCFISSVFDKGSASPFGLDPWPLPSPTQHFTSSSAGEVPQPDLLHVSVRIRYCSSLVSE